MYNYFKTSILALAVLAGSCIPALAQVGDPLPMYSPSGIKKVGTVPVNGTSEIQTLTIGGTPSGGTFKLTFQGRQTAAITWVGVNATLVANIDAALELLPNVGTGGVVTAVGTMTAGVGTITITMAGNLAKLAVTTITQTNNSMTGTAPTCVVAETTPGVTADGRTTTVGQLAITMDAGLLYINTSTTTLNPAWVKVGAQ